MVALKNGAYELEKGNCGRRPEGDDAVVFKFGVIETDLTPNTTLMFCETLAQSFVKAVQIAAQV
jgi:hypothetical protein